MKKIYLSFVLAITPLLVTAGPCDPGQGDSILICVNEPVNLFNILSGDPDLSGQWYDYNNDSIDAQIQAGELNVPGAYDFMYVISSSTCNNDTAFVRLTAYQCDLGLLENAKSVVTVYPNPASKVLQIKNFANNSIRPVLMDVKGSILIKIPEFQTETTVDISTLPKGRYWLTFLDEGNRRRSLVFLKE